MPTLQKVESIDTYITNDSLQYGVVKVVFTSLALLLAIEQAGRKECLIYGGLGQAFTFFYIAIFQAVHTSSDVGPAS